MASISDLDRCPHCNSKLKSGMLGTTKLLPAGATEAINLYSDKKSEAYCTNCGNFLLTDSIARIDIELAQIANGISQLLPSIPVISLQMPLNWDYQVFTMLTAQTVTGTGIISEVTSSFTDLFGAQSNRYNNKLKAGEIMCFNSLRLQAIEYGCNAIIGTDIDYSEVGGGKGMLMVCMSGTGVIVKNKEVLGEDYHKNAPVLEKLMCRKNDLEDLKERASEHRQNN